MFQTVLTFVPEVCYHSDGCDEDPGLTGLYTMSASERNQSTRCNIV